MRRIVAIGDLHGDLESALGVLRMARVIDDSSRWAGGNDTVLVQTGNVIDYGPDTKGLLSLLSRLVREANSAGGRVVQLLGNHEIMNMMGDLRFVRERPDEFLSPDTRAVTFSSTGYLGSRLFNLPLVHQVGDTVFARGGITPLWAGMGVRTINSQARSELNSYANNPKHATSMQYPFLLGKESPAQYASYAMESNQLACKVLEHSLSIMDAKRMVVGHTVQKSGKIHAQCGGRLFFINTGISRAIQGKQSALEVLPDGTVRAIYPSGSVDLVPASGSQTPPHSL
ncbi:Metallo-dependent phosphatase-like protein [Thamnocephalis sphaerospora]|uniref:Metallo-dependent phosphatase-like protein n=1 Tax=Thamnocephalis sphaerospora TaxID=78915 RepID=A0A4P9XQ31_9FUNG|nr:Metallo-dependent phosphatase-like protein [Thamnocephalis sphaerospora]|eukprot:RKP08133.1 Metallo-dependent phosphatase-like protein [Thamnocephalis sphaerospora]